MVKGITFLRPVGSALVNDRLASFFSALGFAPGKGWQGENTRGVSFLAPLGNLELVDGQFPSTAEVLVEVTSLDAAHQAAATWLRLHGTRLKTGASLAAHLAPIGDTPWGARIFTVNRSRASPFPSGLGPIRCAANRSPSKEICPPPA